MLTFGGTKNGCLGVEAVVLFDPARAWEFELRRKRGGHLFSKHRFLSAQMEAYLEGDLWLDLAEAANARARELSEGIAALPGAALVHPTEANTVFASWPRARHWAAQAAGAHYYLWPADQSLEGPEEEPLVGPARLQLGDHPGRGGAVPRRPRGRGAGLARAAINRRRVRLAAGADCDRHLTVCGERPVIPRSAAPRACHRLRPGRR